MGFGIKKKSLESFFRLTAYIPWLVLITILLGFGALLYPSLVAKEQVYMLGDVAEKDIKAPEDFFIEDKDATDKKRIQAAGTIVIVYDYDPGILLNIKDRIDKTFSEFNKMLTEPENKAQNTPESKSSEAVDSEQQAAQQASEAIPAISPIEAVISRKEHFEKAIGIKVSQDGFKTLIENKFAGKIPEFTKTILTNILENGVVVDKDALLKEAETGITFRNIATKSEIQMSNLKHFYGMDQAKTMVRIVGDPVLKNLHHTQLNLIVAFSKQLIQPNITINPTETQARKKAAAEAVKPILFKIKAGEMLLREGERVTEIQLLKLKALQGHSDNEQMIITGLGALFILAVFLIIQFFVLTKSNQIQQAETPNRNILFMGMILLLTMATAKISLPLSDLWSLEWLFSGAVSSMGYGIPIAAGAMAVCLFLGFKTALSFAVVSSISAAMILQNQFEIFIYFLLSSTMAAYWVQHCRERKVIIKAGAKLGLLNMVLCIAINIYTADISMVKLTIDMVFAFIGGLSTGIITVGMAPLVEMTFGYATDITLLELANLDRPILRRLMLEAPGTYHHSVIVGSLVEAAAGEINANPLLAKVCGYYHDIGKLRQPLYFIENQRNGKNKHDKLAPSMSALILISHIKSGVETAKKHKLGKPIIDTIQQHHGTSLISYFYEKARQLKGEDAVKIDDFRYSGPKPKTIEAALVMLADVVEAASRTLDNPTPSRIQGLVQTLINKIFSDGQLDDCELTLKDLHNIAKSFNKILNGIHHHRIEYQESLNGTEGKSKNGSANRQQANQPRNTPSKGKGKSSSHLRRLGLS